MRQVIELQEACLATRPRALPTARQYGSRRAGLAYERLVASRTGGLHGQWFKYRDINGSGYCQTDVILQLDGAAYVLEVKLANVKEALKQLLGLYIPVVRRALGKPAFGIVITRCLTPDIEPASIVTSLGAAIERAKTTVPVVHWLGRGNL